MLNVLLRLCFYMLICFLRVAFLLATCWLCYFGFVPAQQGEASFSNNMLFTSLYVDCLFAAKLIMDKMAHRESERVGERKIERKREKERERKRESERKKREREIERVIVNMVKRNIYIKTRLIRSTCSPTLKPLTRSLMANYSLHPLYCPMCVS